jgi:hypothetical protein
LTTHAGRGGSEWFGLLDVLAKAEATPLLPLGGSGANGPPAPMLMYLVAPPVCALLRAKS